MPNVSDILRRKQIAYSMGAETTSDEQALLKSRGVMERKTVTKVTQKAGTPYRMPDEVIKVPAEKETDHSGIFLGASIVGLGLFLSSKS